jgi:hypothetical protein
MAEAATTEKKESISLFDAYLPVVVGWILPGGGHFVLKKWGRGALLLASIGVMFAAGLGMRGKLYSFNPGDIVDILAWFADVGAGGLFYVSRFLGYEVPEPATAIADYGTKFLLTAGLLNMLAMMDAYDIAVKHKD